MHHRHWRRRHGWGHGFEFWSGSWGGVGRARFFGPGEVRLALLSLLSERPMHGYELMRELESRSGGMYRASAGTVYPTLQQLEDEGLVTSESQEGKRVYRLTDAGRAELDGRAEAVRRIWRRADDWCEWESASAPEAWEVARPAMRVVKAALRAVAGARNDPARIDRVRGILDETAEALERLARDA
jgi:DNA-binding PadR family transcriptional regulator